MITNHTVESLIHFEKEIESVYNEGRIAAPIHLRGGNEQQVIDIFEKEKIRDQDHCYGTWAFHLESLLKGVPPEELKKAILDKRSITLCFKKQNIVCSAIVGSIAAIATGAALSIKRAGKDERVFVFLGDMSSFCGTTLEAIRYAQNFKLPIRFIVSDNEISVKTPTKEAWGLKDGELEAMLGQFDNVIYYKYKNTYSHSGTGVRVNFW